MLCEQRCCNKWGFSCLFKTAADGFSQNLHSKSNTFPNQNGIYCVELLKRHSIRLIKQMLDFARKAHILIMC